MPYHDRGPGRDHDFDNHPHVWSGNVHAPFSCWSSTEPRVSALYNLPPLTLRPNYDMTTYTCGVVLAGGGGGLTCRRRIMQLHRSSGATHGAYIKARVWGCTVGDEAMDGFRLNCSLAKKTATVKEPTSSIVTLNYNAVFRSMTSSSVRI